MAPTSQQPACMACLYGIVQAKCKLTSQVGAITHCLRFYYKPVSILLCVSGGQQSQNCAKKCKTFCVDFQEGKHCKTKCAGKK